ncbi:MAG: alpha-ribazole phosphatase family protein [Paracoccaceae bacterium]|nr:alpha-ribazole phosphatase family protein [Paracoccaceae bacterium]
MGLTFLRHTTPDVAKGICYGMTDLGLAENCEAEFAAAVKSLPKSPKIVCSPLQRCKQLALHIAGHWGMAVDVVDGLREMDFGRWEMVPWNDIPRAELDEWAADFMDANPHGGESVRQLSDRVKMTLGGFADDTLVVTHSGVIRAAAAISDHPYGWEIDVKFGRWVQMAG